MYDQLEATKNFCANVGPRNKKRFLNPPMYNMTITEENGRVNEKRPRAVFNCLKLVAPSSTHEKNKLT